jgi:predicted RNA-binding Zn-ribbon protein involved in translation (DUF1610 family)
MLENLFIIKIIIIKIKMSDSQCPNCNQYKVISRLGQLLTGGVLATCIGWLLLIIPVVGGLIIATGVLLILISPMAWGVYYCRNCGWQGKAKEL